MRHRPYVVASNEQLGDLMSIWSKVLREYPVPYPGVEPHLLDLPSVRHVPTMHHRIDVLFPEMH